MNGFEKKIERDIERHGLMESGGRYIAALSGGPDSVALLLALHHLGYNIEAAHCNFKLRGSESDRDEAFCKSLCEREGIALHIIHFDTKCYAQLHKVSIEMAARDLRYHWFAELAKDMPANAVCIAHHSDDQVETILLNIIRGTGLRGLLGMHRKNGIFIRPMLGVSEVEVMEYLKAMGQDYVVDSSNLVDDVQRNKLRLNILPMLQKVNPGVKDNILRMAENLSDVSAIVDESLAHAIKAASISANIFDMAVIRQYTSPFTLLWTILSKYGFNRTQAEEVAANHEDNRQWTSQGSIAIVSRDKLYIVDKATWEQPSPEMKIPETGLYSYDNRHLRITEKPVDKDFKISKEPQKACLDSGKVSFPLIIRGTRQGDRFTPFGMRGSKLVSDYLKDRKKDIISRHNQLVVTDSQGRILWLVGERVDDRFKVTAKTGKVFILEMLK